MRILSIWKHLVFLIIKDAKTKQLLGVEDMLLATAVSSMAEYEFDLIEQLIQLQERVDVDFVAYVDTEGNVIDSAGLLDADKPVEERKWMMALT